MLVPNGWIAKHRHDLDNWKPTIELIRPGSKQTIVIKDKKAEKEVIKIMKEKRK
jgi:hypothetical protein